MQQVRLLACASHQRLLRGGDVLCEAGAPGGCLVVVASGRIAVQGGGAGSWECAAGEVIGERELLHGASWAVAAQALGECVVLVLAHEDFMDLAQHHVGLLHAAFRWLIAQCLARQPPASPQQSCSHFSAWARRTHRTSLHTKGLGTRVASLPSRSLPASPLHRPSMAARSSFEAVTPECFKLPEAVPRDTDGGDEGDALASGWVEHGGEPDSGPPGPTIMRTSHSAALQYLESHSLPTSPRSSEDDTGTHGVFDEPPMLVRPSMRSPRRGASHRYMPRTPGATSPRHSTTSLLGEPELGMALGMPWQQEQQQRAGEGGVAGGVDTGDTGVLRSARPRPEGLRKRGASAPRASM